MLGPPINDVDCLSKATATVADWLRYRRTELEAEGAKYTTTAALAESIRQRPQLNDIGRPRLGEPVITCDVPQRARLNPADPNCFERALNYAAIAEIIDPFQVRQLSTLSGLWGRHTIIAENGYPVYLDPYQKPITPTRNEWWRR